VEDFPTIDRHSSGFKNNFLRAFIFILNLNEGFNVENHKEKILKKFESTYPRINNKKGNLLSFKLNTPSGQNSVSETTESQLELKSEDGKRVALFSNGTIRLEISGEVYSSFDDILSRELQWISEIIETAQIKIGLLQLKKINILGYEATESERPISIASRVFNDKLISNNIYIPCNQKSFRLKLDTLRYAYEKFDLNVKYGVIADNENSGKIVLDIDCIKGNGFSGDLIQLLAQANQKIFDVFYWALNDEAKELLKKE